MSGINIEQVFTAESQSVFDLLTVEGQGCYVPAYQRPYTWDTDNVHRLLEDATLGLAKLAEDADSIRFLGTIIAIQGASLVDVPEPLNRELPTRVLTVIDGQQRLCTLIILNIVLHDALYDLGRQMTDEEHETVRWLKEDTEDFLDELAKTFRFVGRGARARDRHHWYPRVIRAYDDRWARSAPMARYASPVARFIWEYVEHIEDGVNARFEYAPINENDETPEDHEPVLKVIKYLREAVDGLADGAYENLFLPTPAEILGNAHFRDGLWAHPLPPHLAQFLADEDEHALHATFEKAVRLAAFARYVNQGMAVTVVLTQAEDHAFDMFESLNTTGLPLTAFETFKPKVIEAEGLAAYQTSDSRTAVEKVQTYLDRFTRADERQNAASTLMIPFALVEEGHKLEKHLSAQRRYLRDAYARARDIAAKRQFTTSLARTAQFVGLAWRPPRRQAPQLLPHAGLADAQAEFCIEALREIRHEVAIAPIARFYAAYCEAPPAGRAAAAVEYFAAIKAVSAFSMLWRASLGGTANIDSVYRDIMRRGAADVQALSRRGGVAPSAANLRAMLRHYLDDEKIDRETWVRNASQLPIYRVGQVVTKFLLFAASHDAMPDEDEPGLIEPGRANTNPMLTRDNWHDEANLSVEHVAPNSPSDGWPEDVYEDQRTVQRLGNFILVPKAENNLLANRPWAQKRVLYKLFSSKTVRQAGQAIRDAQREGFNVGRTAEDLVETSRYLPMCEAVAAFEGEWDEAFIAERGSRLAGLAWDRLWRWLDEPTPRARRRAPTL